MIKEAPAAIVISRESRKCMRRSVVNLTPNGKRCNRPFSLQNRVHGFHSGRRPGLVPSSYYALAAAVSDRAGSTSRPSSPAYGLLSEATLSYTARRSSSDRRS